MLVLITGCPLQPVQRMSLQPEVHTVWGCSPLHRVLDIGNITIAQTEVNLWREFNLCASSHIPIQNSYLVDRLRTNHECNNMFDGASGRTCCFSR